MALSILIVDDSETMRRNIKKTLHLTPIEIDTIHGAATGKQALEILRENSIDLVISNITMPEMSGHELLKTMQVEEALKQIPVIILSAAVSQAQLKPLLTNRVSGHLRKPFAREILRDLVRKVLGEAYES